MKLVPGHQAGELTALHQQGSLCWGTGELLLWDPNMLGDGWREELMSGITKEEEENRWLHILHIPWNLWSQKLDQWVQVLCLLPSSTVSWYKSSVWVHSSCQDFPTEVNALEITVDTLAGCHGLSSVWCLSLCIFQSHATALQLSSQSSATPLLCLAWGHTASYPLAFAWDLEEVLEVTPIHLWAPQTLFCCHESSKNLEVSDQLRLSLFILKREKSSFFSGESLHSIFRSDLWKQISIYLLSSEVC